MTPQEINAAVAEKVMGEVQPEVSADTDDQSVTINQLVWRRSTTGYENGDEPIWEAPNFCGDIAQSWRVVEKLMADGWTVTLAPRQFEKFPEDRFKFYGVRFVGDPQKMESFSDHADSAPMAICLAALKAVALG